MTAQYRPAAWMLYLSAALHGLAPFVSDFSAGSLGLVVFVVIWGVIGYVLVTKGYRWLAWIAFIGLLFGAIAAFVGLSDVPSWLMLSIAAVDAIAVLLLFLVLWKSPATA